MYGRTGVLNPFFGRQHTEESKDKSRQKMKGRKISPEHAAKIAIKGKQNLIVGDVNLYWIARYGPEVAKIKKEARRVKASLTSSGSGNPMFGKPTPLGSGNGWSGWYNGWYFRSLRELKVVLALDRLGIEWRTAESKEFRVNYTKPTGVSGTYTPDFLVNRTLIECKPKKLWDTPLVRAKAEAATKHYKTLGLKYKLIDPGPLCSETIKTLVERGTVKFTDRYTEKYNQKYNQGNNT